MDALRVFAISFSILATVLCDTDPIPCVLNDVNSKCPNGYCCVRDTYLFSETYCKPFGQDGDACVTKPSFFECPCVQNYYCKSNLVSHILSHFGKCRLILDYTTEVAPAQLHITESTSEDFSTEKPNFEGVVG
ncbi:uncharacterized protein LOC123553537 [Mercenaria mercenaria]|uniref:uncharacterized protein LOC123553537 n=1 Tax=Mercenaria mercenaria TaxID=6596 RepID=UPI00234F2853|nr:uncharacterized protein LOC123553537 [Mercenaria mercenaria]